MYGKMVISESLFSYSAVTPKQSFRKMTCLRLSVCGRQLHQGMTCLHICAVCTIQEICKTYQFWTALKQDRDVSGSVFIYIIYFFMVIKSIFQFMKCGIESPCIAKGRKEFDWTVLQAALFLLVWSSTAWERLDVTWHRLAADKFSNEQNFRTQLFPFYEVGSMAPSDSVLLLKVWIFRAFVRTRWTGNRPLAKAVPAEVSTLQNADSQPHLKRDWKLLQSLSSRRPYRP
jgi:hypothetical protein